MKPLVWDREKNNWLIENRGVSFEMVEDEVAAGRFRTAYNRSKRHPDQKIIIVGFLDPTQPKTVIVHVVPYIEYEDRIELKTIFFSSYWQEIYEKRI